MTCFGFEKWSKAIGRSDWYFDIVPDFNKIVAMKEKDEELYEKCAEEVYAFFEDNLEDKRIALGKTGVNWDAERRPIDTIVIHHTSHAPGMTKERLSAIELIRLYAAYYFDPTYAEDEDIKGTPIYSAHFRKGKQIFYPYHWMVRKDGTKERLLLDSEIGWHSGDWDVNCRSIGIVLDNDYENSTPSDIELQAIVEIIKENYPQVRKENIFGHREINPKKTCPSNLFFGENGWKKRLLELI